MRIMKCFFYPKMKKSKTTEDVKPGLFFLVGLAK